MDKFTDSIKEKYQERLIYLEEQWPPCYSSELVKLELVERKKGKGYFANQQRGGENEIIKRTPIAYGDLFKVESRKRRVRKVLIEGDAGIGKTTLCISVSEDWANGKLFQQFELLLLLPLRHNEIVAAGSLTELLRLLHPSKKLCASVADSLEENEGRKVLIIADGWDELSEVKRQKDSFLHRLIFGKLLPFVSVLLTSRPFASAPLHRLPSIDRYVEVCGFSKDNIKEYIQAEFYGDQEKADRLLWQLDTNPLIESVSSVPLNCAIVCHLWRTFEEDLPTTMTELYTKIILNVTVRNIQKNEAFESIDSLSSFDALPEGLQSSWALLCKFAFQSLEKDQMVYSREELVEFFPQGHALDENFLCFGLLQTAKSILQTGCGTSFHFLHLTFQEYLAALYVVKQLLEDRQAELNQVVREHKIFRSLAKSERFVMVWRFVFGMYANKIQHSSSFAIQTISKFTVRYYDSKTKNLALCHCAFEAKNELVNKEMSKSLEANGLFSIDFGHSRNAHDCSAVIYVIDKMQECSSGIDINFDNSGVRENQIRKLINVLARKQGKLQINELNLNGNKLTDESVKRLFHRASAAFFSLRTLHLTGNRIGAKSIVSITSAITNSPFSGLSYLNLTQNPVGVSGMQALEDAASGQSLANLEQLHLQKSLTSDADINGALLATSMEALLSHCPSLRRLDLSQNNLGVPGASALARILSQHKNLALPPPPYSTLFNSSGQRTWLVNMDETNLCDEGLGAFIKNIIGPCHFGNLQLKANNIHATGMTCLADGVCSERIVVQEGFKFVLRDDINLDDNSLGLEGTVAVGSMISSNHFQEDTTISLSKCQLTATGPGHLNPESLNPNNEYTAELVRRRLCQLPQSTAVTWLILDYNDFTGEGINVLTSFMHLCPNLNVLSCGDCKITSDDLILLFDQLTELQSSSPNICGKLKSWNLDNNEVDDSGVYELMYHLLSLFPRLCCSVHDRICLTNNQISRETMKTLDEEILRRNKVIISTLSAHESICW